MLSAGALTFRAITDVTGADRVLAAELVASSLPAYYAAIRSGMDDGGERLVELLGHPGGETQNLQVAHLESGQIAGVVSGLNAAELQRAQLVDLQAAFRKISSPRRLPLQQELAQLGATTEAIADDSWYLSRIAVASTLQGAGVAAQLLQHFFATDAGAKQFSLHVHQDNSRAIQFYHKHGFRFATSDDAEKGGMIYRSMYKRNNHV
jgi:ribosomal protein S18 acetylase RimI-like enzyme